MKAATKGPAATAYARYFTDREPYLQRARDVSRLTVTSLFQEQGSTGATALTVPWQSFGAYALNTLAAKGVLGLYPPGVPFIEIEATKKALKDLEQLSPEDRGKLKAAIDKGLSATEADFTKACEKDGDRMVSFDAFRHMLAGGNHCIAVKKDGKLRGIPLERYVVSRDNSGEIIEAVIEDQMSWWTLPEDIKDLAIRQGYEVQYETEGNKMPSAQQAPISVYTRVYRAGTQYKVCQECWGEDVPGTEYTYDPDALPFMFLRMVALKDESYGRSYFEDYQGDLQSLDGLWQIIIEGSAAVAQLKWLVRPGGVTDKKTFANAANGAVITGDKDDIHAAISEKQGELAVAAQMAERIESRLSKVCLLYSSIQRAGERVTKEEIVTLRRDLDAGLGGVYSNQAVLWQAPYARLKMQALQRTGRLAKLPSDLIDVGVLTGDAALGRQIKSDAVDELIGKASALFPQVIGSYVNVGNYLARAAAAGHVDPDGLIKTDEEMAEEAAQAQQTALAQNVAPEVVKQAGEVIQNSQQAQLAANVPPSEGAPQ